MVKIVFIILVLLMLPCTGFASSMEKSIKEGNALYEEKKFDGALGKYNEALEKDPYSHVINFDVGAALYKKNDYHEAIGHFQKTLLTNDEKLKEKAYYNLGNAFYKSGIEKEEKDLNAAVNLLKKSLEEYEKTLVLNVKNEDAIFNYEFVKKELERIEKKQQQKKQKDSQDQKQDSDKSDQQKNQSGHGLRLGGSDKSDEQKNQSGQDQQKGKQTKQQESDQKKETNQSEASKKGEPEKEQDMNVDSTRQMSKEEAESLLMGYKHNEEPQGLLNFHLGAGSKQRVLKDW